MPTPSLNSWQVFSIPPAERDTIAPRPANCPVCGAAECLPRFRFESLASVQWDCRECGLGWLHPLPSDEQLASFYPNDYYGAEGVKFRKWIEVVVRLVGARHLRFLTRHLARGASVLDIGCGRGVLLSELANRGFRAYGTELSAAACVGADPRAEIRICRRLGEAQFEADSFDQVILWHVFEHLSDPVETLDEIRRILKPTGTVVIAVPNYSSWQARWSGPAWFHLDPPRHLYHFPLKSLERLLSDHGFAVLSRHHFSLRQNPFGWVQSALNLWGWQPRNGLYTWLQRRSCPAGTQEPLARQVAYAAAFAVGMPVATLLEMLATIARQGATVHVVAGKQGR